MTLSIATQWRDGQVGLVIHHGETECYTGFVDPHDPEARAKVALAVCESNGFDPSHYGLLADQVDKAIESAIDDAPDRIVHIGADEDVPPIPLDAFPDEVSDFIVAIADRHEVGVEIPFSCALGTIASLLQTCMEVHVNDSWREQMCLWILALAPPSFGKSPIMNSATDELKRMISERQSEWMVQIATHNSLVRIAQSKLAAAEKRMSSQKKADDSGKYIPRSSGVSEAEKFEIDSIARELKELSQSAPPCPDWIMGDTTKEGVRKKFAVTKGYAAVLDDEAAFVNNTIAARYSKSTSSDELDTLRQAFNGKEMNCDRGGEDFAFKGRCHLTILQVVQPHVMLSFKDSEAAMERGTFNRFLVIWAMSHNIGNRHRRTTEAPARVTDRYNEMIRSLYRQSEKYQGNHFELKVSKEALDYRDALDLRYEKYRDPAEPQVLAADGKLFGSMLFRLAGILHALNHGIGVGQIGVDSMQKAGRIIEVLRAHILKSIRGMQSDPRSQDAMKVINHIRATTGSSPVKRSDLHYALNSNYRWRVDRTEAALALMQDHNYIRIEKKGPRSFLITPHRDFMSIPSPEKARSTRNGT